MSTQISNAIKLHRSIRTELQRDEQAGKPCQDKELLCAFDVLHRNIAVYSVTKNPGLTPKIVAASKRLREVLEIPEGV